MRQRVTRLYWVCVYYLSFVLFGLVGLGLNVACAVLLLAPNRARVAPHVRTAIRALFRLFVAWLNASGVVRVTFAGFERPLEKGTVYIGNHPSLIDAPALLAQVPDAFCIFKRALLRNPVTGPAAIMGEYLGGEDGVDIVRKAAARVLAGQSLLIFPEGTRTAIGNLLGPLKPGFALIAIRARAPVQLVLIRRSRDLVARGRRWWCPPAELPGSLHVELADLWPYDERKTATELTAEIERTLREALLARKS